MRSRVYRASLRCRVWDWVGWGEAGVSKKRVGFGAGVGLEGVGFVFLECRILCRVWGWGRKVR